MIFKQKAIIVYEGDFKMQRYMTHQQFINFKQWQMALHVLDGDHIDTFCRYENSNSMRFDWVIQPTKNGAVAFFRQLTALFNGKGAKFRNE